MAITASGQGEAKDFQPISAALHHAVCYAAIDLGTQPSADPKYPDRRKVIYMFEVPEETIKIDGEDMPRVISATYTVSLNEKGKLRPMLESWRGRPFTQDELNAFDVSNVVGANCYLNITHTTKNGKTYANIASVNPLPKGVTKVQSKLEHVKWSFEDQGSKIVLPAAPDWILKKIMASTEYINAQQKGAHVSDGAAYIPGDDHDDDDIGEPPF